MVACGFIVATQQKADVMAMMVNIVWGGPSPRFVMNQLLWHESFWLSHLNPQWQHRSLDIFLRRGPQRCSQKARMPLKHTLMLDRCLQHQGIHLFSDHSLCLSTSAAPTTLWDSGRCGLLFLPLVLMNISLWEKTLDASCHLSFLVGQLLERTSVLPLASLPCFDLVDDTPSWNLPLRLISPALVFVSLLHLHWLASWLFLQGAGLTPTLGPLHLLFPYDLPM